MTGMWPTWRSYARAGAELLSPAAVPVLPRLTAEDRSTIRGALNLLQQKIEGHDYGPDFTGAEAYELRREALDRIASVRRALR